MTSSRKRRQVLKGLAALLGASCAPYGFAQPASMQSARFAGLSRALTGFAYEDPTLAASMLRALAADVGEVALARIAAIASATPPDKLTDTLRAARLDAAAGRVVTALYSGVVQTPQGPVVLTYDDALAWQAIPWTKPNALCGGLTDYWASVPVASK
jgi:hypothetical protein